MQALVFRGAGRIVLEEVAEPEIGPDEALIKVACCGICGSDLHGYLGHSARRSRNVPLVMGHEFCGKVVALGSRVSSEVKIGQRVCVQPVISCGACAACRSGSGHLCPNMALIGIERQGGFAPLVAVPANRLFPLADHIDDAVAAFAETLAVEVHLFRTQIPPLARNLLILGAGAQGLLALQLARMLNIADILVSDVEPERLRIAHELGATVTIDAREKDPVAIAKERTEGWGLEVAIDTSGSPAARIHGAQSLAPAGLLCLIGLGVGPTTVDMLPIVSREISIRGSYCYTDDDFARSLELLTDGSVRCDKLLSLAPLNAGPQEFEALIQSPGNRVKVLLQPQLNVG